MAALHPTFDAHDAALPLLDVRALARRAALPLGLMALVAVAAAVAGGPLRAFADALGRALDVIPGWVVAAMALELLSFVGYVVLLWLVGGRATPRLGLRASTHVTLNGAAATRLLPTGGVGGAALTIWAFRRAGLDTRGATRTLLAFFVVLYAVFLGSIMAAGGILAVGLGSSSGPLALSAGPAVGAALAIAAVLFLAARRPSHESPIGATLGRPRRARVSAALRSAPSALGIAARDAIALVRSGDVRLLGALAWWGFDAAVLWAMLEAFGTPPAVAVVVLGYFVGQLANTIPIPGAVTGGTIGVLIAFGVAPDLALVSVLAYRALAIWLPATIGPAALGGLRRTVTEWGRVCV